MQNFPRQLAMQSCALCVYVRCGSSWGNDIIRIMLNTFKNIIVIVVVDKILWRALVLNSRVNTCLNTHTICRFTSFLSLFL